MERTDVVLFANRTANVDLQLTVGAWPQIKVTAPGFLINTETATTNYVKTGDHLEDMALLMRQSDGNMGFAIYNPGAGVNTSANIYANGVRQIDTFISTDGIVEMSDPTGVGGGQIHRAGPGQRGPDKLHASRCSRRIQKPGQLHSIAQIGHQPLLCYRLLRLDRSRRQLAAIFSPPPRRSACSTTSRSVLAVPSARTKRSSSPITSTPSITPRAWSPRMPLGSLAHEELQSAAGTVI